MTLHDFLAQKPLFYAEFDPERITKVWQSIKGHFTLPPVIHLVGTNGKGTTGRFLAQFLHNRGRKTGHYTSPHILRFNERIWLDGSECDDATLETAHRRLQDLLNPDDAAALSYFEYTTLLAAAVFERHCDYAVMEAGLGGEFDATAIFEPDLLLVTPIGRDHEAFLGSTVEAVAATKLRVIKSDSIVGYQNEEIVYRLAQKEAEKIGKNVRFLYELHPRPDRGDYLDENRLLAFEAARYLGFDPRMEEFEKNTLFGRFSQILPNVILDVGHNAMAADAIRKRLGKRKVKLVYNTLEDKEYRSILLLLKQNIIDVEIIEIQDTRALAKTVLERTLGELNIPYRDFTGVNRNDEYLVFGSFKTAEAFCKRLNET